MSSNSSTPQETIRCAWREGRRIVPLLGAGISVDSGMPVVQGIERYLAQLHHFINQASYLQLTDVPATETKLFDPLVEAYRQKPHEYIRKHQWPDRFQLQRNLLQVSKGEKIQTIVDSAFRELYEPDMRHVKQFMMEQAQSSGSALKALFGNWRKLIEKFTDFDEGLADSLVARLHKNRNPGTAHRYVAFLSRLALFETILTFNFDSLIEKAFTEQGLTHQVFAMEYGDTFPSEQLLAESLSLVKMHGDTHRLLMDERLDRPLSTEYLRLLQEGLQPSGDENAFPLFLVLGCGGTEERCISILRHFQQSYETLKTMRGSPFAVWIHHEQTVPELLSRCLPAERRQISVGEELKDKLSKSGIETAHALNPGFFLMELHSHITNRFPSSKTNYLAHIDRPLGLRDSRAKDLLKDVFDLRAPPTVVVFDSRGTDKSDPLAASASDVLADFMSKHDSSFYPIWVDLEDCYSVADAVGYILDQARRHDPSIPPSVFRLDDVGNSLHDLNHSLMSPTELDAAVARVSEVLKRAPFLIAFDAVDAFGWAPTSHHGYEVRSKDYVAPHLTDVMNFLERLCSQKDTNPYPLGGSRIAIAINQPRARFPNEESQLANHYSWNATLVEQWQSESESSEGYLRWVNVKTGHSTLRVKPILSKGDIPVATLEGEGEADKKTLAGLKDLLKDPGGLELLLLRLSTCRRTRTLVALRNLLPKEILAQTEGDEVDSEEVDRLLKTLVDLELLRRVEGGGYWMNRNLRDGLYSLTTDVCAPDELKNRIEAWEGDANAGDNESLQSAVKQLWLLFAEHDRWADWYFDHNHIHSGDPHAFFEYVYHRSTSLRIIAILKRLAFNKNASVAKLTAGAIQKVTEDVIQLTRGSESPNISGTWFLQSFNTLSDGLIDQLPDRLRNLQLTRVKWFATVWSKCRGDLANTIGAERILHFLRWILSQDFGQYRSELTEGSTGASQDELEQQLEELKGILVREWQHLAFQRMDYAAAAKIAAFQSVSDVLQWRANGCEAIYPSARSSSALNPSTCITAIGQLKTLATNKSNSNEQQEGLMAGVWALRLGLDAEECTREPAKLASLKDAFDTNATGLSAALSNYCEKQLENLHGWLATDPIEHADSSVKNQLWLRICRSRIHLLECTETTAVRHFEAAYLLLDAARSFAKNQPPHRQGVVELYAGQTLFAHAEFLSLDKVKPSAARSKLAAARSAMTRAAAHLRAGRRGTRWWRYYYNLVAKLAIWECLLECQSLKDVSDSGEVLDANEIDRQNKVVSTLMTVGRGIEGIRSRTYLQATPVSNLKDLKAYAAYPYALCRALYRVGWTLLEVLDQEGKYKELWTVQFGNLLALNGLCNDPSKTKGILDKWAAELRDYPTSCLREILGESAFEVCLLPWNRRRQ